MNVFVLACALALSGSVQRDPYGVPKITASSYQEAFYLFGKTVAEDRLWQMENSRHVARGRIAELIGSTGLASDEDTLRTGYTDKEYADMFDALPAKAKIAFTEYARGVNDTIAARRTAGTLPPGYRQNGVDPEPWTVTDSMAIEVMLSRRFGTGGAGELRNLAIYLYLKTQPCKDKVLDVLDDLAWQNDPQSIPTVSLSDDPLAKNHPSFPEATRKQTEDQLAALPKVNLLELLPAIRAANGDDSRLVAETVQAPFETGSYCMAVSGQRSSDGRALLLSGPQMGFTVPSIIHEVALDAPGVQVAGIDVPGIPAVVIGNTPNYAWGLTTGVADIADIVYATRTADDKTAYGTESRPIERIRREIRVKDKDPVVFETSRTSDGPVILESHATNSVFSQRMSYWKKEVAGWSTLYDLYNAKTPGEIDRLAANIAMNMNLFYATTTGDIGWRYLGLMPVRAPGFDPRFPVPSRPDTAWKGFLSPDQMPHVLNPKSGLIANWNNKPVAWWPNLDTPVWGSVFRNEVLLQSLVKPKLSVWDLEHAAWDVARKETDSNGVFGPLFIKASGSLGASDSLAASTINSFDGWTVSGSSGATLYQEAVRQLRTSLFKKFVGNFTNESLFERAVQPSSILRALEHKTKFDYLAGRTKDAVLKDALAAAFKSLSSKYGEEPSQWPSMVATFPSPQGPPVAYSNRGTYIQVTELAPVPSAVSVAPPGVAESGPNSDDQIPLARQWTFKPVWRVGGLKG